MFKYVHVLKSNVNLYEVNFHLLQIASEGNWMHLHYQSKLQAKKALSKDGKIFNNCVMIGVKPCIDKVFLNFDLIYKIRFGKTICVNVYTFILKIPGLSLLLTTTFA